MNTFEPLQVPKRFDIKTADLWDSHMFDCENVVVLRNKMIVNKLILVFLITCNIFHISYVFEFGSL